MYEESQRTIEQIFIVMTIEKSQPFVHLLSRKLKINRTKCYFEVSLWKYSFYIDLSEIVIGIHRVFYAFTILNDVITLYETVLCKFIIML